MARGTIYGVSARNAPDHLSLAAAFVIGVAAILLLKLSPWTAGWSPLWAALATALVISGYAAVVWLSGGLQIEPETIGDNCYYLGFLFTLTSLAVTLYRISPNGEADMAGSAIGEILSGFGVALSSTIVGVFLRVGFMQIRPDIVARDRVMRRDLHQATRDYQNELRKTVLDMKSFGTEIIQHNAEASVKLSARLDQAATAMDQFAVSSAEAVARTLRENTEIITRDIAAMLESVARSANSHVTDAVKSSTDSALTSVQSSIRGMAEAMSEAQHRNDTNLQSQTESMARQTAALQALERLITELDQRRASDLEMMDAARLRFSKLAASLDEMAQALDAQAGAADVRTAASAELARQATEKLDALQRESAHQRGWLRRVLGRRRAPGDV